MSEAGKCEKLALVVLSLWSVASLITIVVWATAPDFKSAAKCRAELHDLTVQHEGSKVVHQKNQEALEEMVRRARQEQERLGVHILELNEGLNATERSLDDCRAGKLVLLTNISALQDTVDSLEQRQANLSTQLLLKEDQVEALHLNLTQAEHQTQTCFSLQEAAEAQSRAAESQTRGCQANLSYLHKQLQKCKVSESEAAQQTTPQKTPSGPTGSGERLRAGGILVLALLVAPPVLLALI